MGEGPPPVTMGHCGTSPLADCGTSPSAGGDCGTSPCRRRLLQHLVLPLSPLITERQWIGTQQGTGGEEQAKMVGSRMGLVEDEDIPWSPRS